jgi:hypothetical protein
MPLIAVSSFELRVLAVSWQLLSLPTVPVSSIAAPSKTRHKEYTSGSFFAHRSGLEPPPLGFNKPGLAAQ